MGVICIVCALAAIAGSGAGGQALSILGMHDASIPGMHAGVQASGTPSGLPEASADAKASETPSPLWGDAQPLTGIPSQPSSSQEQSQSASQGQAQSTQPEDNAIPTAASSPVSYTDALRMAQAATVTQPHTDGYDRDSMFGGWAKTRNQCGDGGNTRDLILARDLKDVAWSKTGCHVQSGMLNDPYTGAQIRFTRGKSTSAAIQIDHVVALQDAWASGAWQWPQEQRVAYANSPDVLLAVDGPANEAKGSGVASLARGKADADRKAWNGEVWMPSNTAYQCDYMAKRAWIKNTYGLSMTEGEKSQTVGVLEACAAKSQAY